MIFSEVMVDGMSLVAIVVVVIALLALVKHEH
jgi:hypothetical protein